MCDGSGWRARSAQTETSSWLCSSRQREDWVNGREVCLGCVRNSLQFLEINYLEGYGPKIGKWEQLRLGNLVGMNKQSQIACLLHWRTSTPKDWSRNKERNFTISNFLFLFKTFSKCNIFTLVQAVVINQSQFAFRFTVSCLYYPNPFHWQVYHIFKIYIFAFLLQLKYTIVFTLPHSLNKNYEQAEN